MKFYLYLIIVISISNINCKNSSSVYQTIPRTNEQLRVLRTLSDKLTGILYWRDPTYVNQTVDLQVPENKTEDFKTIMTNNDLSYTVQISNVQELLDKSQFQTRALNPYAKISTFGWTRYHTLNEINNWLSSLTTRYPNIVSLVVAGRSYENREIRGVRLRFSKNNRPVVFIEAGIHAREWLSHATATYLINELLTSKRPEIRNIAESYEWHIFPCVNPDGYVFTHIDPKDERYRLWRKTRAEYITTDCSQYQCFQRNCYGSDLNRNWDHKWGGPGSDVNNACSETFAGRSAFSEIETKTMSQYMSTMKNKIFSYISFHTYIHTLLFPYGHTKQRLNNYNEQYAVGKEALRALSRKYGTQYKIGSIAEMVGVTSGSSIDWANSALNVPFSYCYEMRGQTSRGQFYGFLAPTSEIIPNAEEVVDSLAALLRAAAQSRGYQSKS